MIGPEPVALLEEGLALSKLLHQGLGLVETLDSRLHHLDSLLLTGRPLDIAEAASAVEASLQAASPTFLDITTTLERLGVRNLQTAAHQLRQSDQDMAAGIAEQLRLALRRMAQRSVQSDRRARNLSRGLNATLTALQALGMEETGRLLAEA